MGIAALMTAEQRYRFAPEADKAFRDYVGRRMDQPPFANGRSVRNALDRLRMRHAIRLWEQTQSDEGSKLTKGDLVTIQAEDVMKSRVFEEGDNPDREETH
jgi:hypothetical protein